MDVSCTCLHLAVQTSSHPPSPVLPSIQFCKAVLDSLLVSLFWECVKQTHEKFLIRSPVEKENGVYVPAHVHKHEAN